MSSRVATLLNRGQCTISQLSNTLGISRQATHKAVGNLVDRGYVELKESVDNKKVKTICLTPLGEASFEERTRILQEIENTISDRIGKENLSKLKEILMLDWT